MQLYIYTPLQANSQSIPHFLEHCFGGGLESIQDFFEQKFALSASISGEWTKINFDHSLELEKLLNILATPLSKETYQYEKKIFKSELSTPHFGIRIYEAMLKRIVDPSIELTDWRGISWGKLQKYHQQYYQPDYYLIFEDEVAQDQEYQLLHHGSHFLSKKRTDAQSFLFPFEFEEEAFIMIGIQGASAKEYRTLLGCWLILESYFHYQMRYQQGQYYFATPTWDEFRDYIWISVPTVEKIGLDPEFFEQGKQYLIKLIAKGYFKEKFFLSNYLHGLSVEREEIQEWYHNLTWQDFSQKILEQIARR